MVSTVLLWFLTKTLKVKKKTISCICQFYVALLLIVLGAWDSSRIPIINNYFSLASPYRKTENCIRTGETI